MGGEGTASVILSWISPDSQSPSIPSMHCRISCLGTPPVDVQQDRRTVVLVAIPPAGGATKRALVEPILQCFCTASLCTAHRRHAPASARTRSLPVRWAGSGAAGAPAHINRLIGLHDSPAGMPALAYKSCSCPARTVSSQCCSTRAQARAAAATPLVSSQPQTHSPLLLTGCTRTACPGVRGPPCSAGTPCRPCSASTMGGGVGKQQLRCSAQVAVRQRQQRTAVMPALCSAAGSSTHGGGVDVCR